MELRAYFVTSTGIDYICLNSLNRIDLKKDISDRKDIEQLINTFYDKVRDNEIIGPIFEDVAKVDWNSHLPKMYQFWSGILFGESGFSGNPMRKHIELSRIADMTEVEFSEWLRLFKQTTDELFIGEKAEEAKSRATNIAQMMLYKIGQANSGSWTL